MPNAGLPELGPNGAVYPLTPEELAEALAGFVARVRRSARRRLLRHHRRAHPRRSPRPSARSTPAPARPRTGAGRVVAVPGGAVRAGRQRADDRRAHQRQRLQGVPRGHARRRAARTASRSPGTQTRDGAHMLDLCVDYVGRDGAADMAELAGRFATASTLPIMLDSTEPEVLAAGLEHLGGRCAVNSVNYEDGDGPDSRFQRIMDAGRASTAPRSCVMCIDEEGQARTAEWKVRGRRAGPIDDLIGNWGMRVHDIIVDTLTFPISTGQEEVRRDAHRDDRGDPRAQAALPGRADHARRLEHLLRPEPGRAAGAELGVPARVRAGRAGHRDRARVEDPADGADPGRAARGRARPGLRPPPRGLRPAAEADGAVRGRHGDLGPRVAGGRAGRAAAVRAAGAAHRRRRAQRPRRRPRRRARRSGPRWRSSTTRCCPA